MNDLIEEHHRNVPQQSYTIYIVRPRAITGYGNIGSYAYGLTDDSDEGFSFRDLLNQFSSKPTASQYHSNCLFTHFVSSKQRFIWLDVDAGPIDFGPLTAGQGLIDSHLNHVYSRRYYHASFFDRSMLISDLLTFIDTTCDYLIAPIMDRRKGKPKKLESTHFYGTSSRI
jgi:hypothetical protein